MTYVRVDSASATYAPHTIVGALKLDWCRRGYKHFMYKIKAYLYLHVQYNLSSHHYWVYETIPGRKILQKPTAQDTTIIIYNVFYSNVTTANFYLFYCIWELYTHLQKTTTPIHINLFSGNSELLKLYGPGCVFLWDLFERSRESFPLEVKSSPIFSIYGSYMDIVHVAHTNSYHKKLREVDKLMLCLGTNLPNKYHNIMFSKMIFTSLDIHISKPDD